MVTRASEVVSDEGGLEPEWGGRELGRGGGSLSIPVKPMPFSTVALKMVGMALAYRGWRQYGQAWGQSVRLRCEGTTEARGEYVAKIACGDPHILLRSVKTALEDFSTLQRILENLSRLPLAARICAEDCIRNSATCIVLAKCHGRR